MSEKNETEPSDSIDSRDYTVQGMTCDHCKASVTEELQLVVGVSAIDIDVPSGRVTVKGSASEQAVRSAVAEAGYTVVASDS